jgi:hypothetical protein
LFVVQQAGLTFQHPNCLQHPNTRTNEAKLAQPIELTTPSPCTNTHCRRLMEQYGFTLPGNALDRVSFPPDLLQHQHGWMSHKAVKAAAQEILARQHLQQLQSQHAALKKEHIDAAVASILQHSGWQNAGQYRATSADSTARCAEVMLAFVCRQLDSMPTTLAADAEQLQQLRDSVDGQQGRLLAALQYRLGRKQLLTAVAEVLGAVLANGGRGGE